MHGAATTAMPMRIVEEAQRGHRPQAPRAKGSRRRDLRSTSLRTTFGVRWTTFSIALQPFIDKNRL